MVFDARGVALTGANAKQAAIFDEITADYLDYRTTAFPKLKALCEDAPEFAMAHLLKGFLLLSLGSQTTVPGAQACVDHLRQRGGLNARETGHLAALTAWIEKDTHLACHHWDMVLISEPLDILALKLQHFSLFWQGQAAHMRDAAARVLPAWKSSMPGYAQMLGMYAFALEEVGDYTRAEMLGREAVERHPDDLWAIHAVAHVYEMQGDLKQGIAWLNQPLNTWEDRNPFKDHLWWHTAMFALEKGDFTRVLQLYDDAVWPDSSTFYLDVQNAASLLTRLESFGIDVGSRWEALAIASQDRAGDHVLLFTEPHYTMAFGRTGRHDEAEKQITSLNGFAKTTPTSNARVVEQIAAPVCSAIRDYYRGDFTNAVDGLLPLRYDYQPIGGSHAQRDVFNFYLIDAAIKSKQLRLAKSLLVERLSLHSNSFGTWEKYAGVCDLLNDATTAKHARSQAAQIASAA